MFIKPAASDCEGVTMSTKREGTYISALSGLKALAALMVVFYHLRFPFAQGGLLGVTVFFVISGFTIARSLLKEAEQKNSVDFGNFWLRRIKRILPGLIVLISVTVVLNAIFNRVLFTKECRDIVSVLTGTNNWWQIFNNVSYFENAGAPSPLTHTWSLAIEIQFYLVISLMAVLTARSQSRRKILGIACSAISIVSMALMVILFDPSRDPSRVYYGTDTRIFSLMAGALIAIYEDQIRKLFTQPLIAEGAGWLSLSALGFMMVTISGYDAFMYRGGQIIASGLCCVLVMSLLNQKTLISKLLSLSPLTWCGTYSYGIYLWHYPLMLLITNGEKAGLLKSVCVIVLSVIMSLLSDLLFERPVNKGSYTKALKAMRTVPKTEKGKRRKKAASAFLMRSALMNAVLILSAGLCIALVPRQSAVANIDELEKQAEKASEMTAQKIKEREEAAASTPVTEPAKTEEPVSSAEPVKEKTDEEILNEIDLLLIGDSVALGASEAFYEVFPYSICDAAVSRYTTESFTIYDIWRYEHGWDGYGVIFALGANGMLYDSLPTLREMITPQRPFFLLTARAPHTEWGDINNEEMHKFASEHENTYIIDWYAYSEGHPEYFIEDGTHLTPEGTKAYAECIRQAVLEVYRAREKENA